MTWAHRGVYAEGLPILIGLVFRKGVMYDVRLILPGSAHERRGLRQCPGFLAPSAVRAEACLCMFVCAAFRLKKRRKPKTTRTKTAQTYSVNKFGLILMQSARIFRMFANAITRHRTKDPHINILKRLLRTHLMISGLNEHTRTWHHNHTRLYHDMLSFSDQTQSQNGNYKSDRMNADSLCDHAKIWNERSDHTLQHKHARWSNILCLLGDWRGKCLTVFEHLFPPPLNTRQSYRSAFRSKTS